ncbi:MAG TPA: glycosyltransferase [Rhizomicrobium sp.]|jgi:glycosyltransferase involved in cell wall biosynthesis|nr:glycosyltransferase [Rhizomicrobium sp.]
MILNCMFARGFGGLEKLFLDEIEMLCEAGMPARGLVRRGSDIERHARERGLAFDAIETWSDWDPVSRARASQAIRRAEPRLILCVGRSAHRLMARVAPKPIPIVPMVQKRRFDPNFRHNGVLAAAEHRRRTLIDDGEPAENIIVIPNAVRLPPPKSDYRLSSPARLCALGRLHEKKGFGMLIDAVAQLVARGIDCGCTIAGEGPERGDLEARIARAGLNSRVALPGWTDRVADFLSPADVFVLPSFQEDFPLAVLDAMASGMPIVASAIDGPRDFLVDGRTALLVPPNDSPALANAIARLIKNDSLRESLGRATRHEAEQHYSFSAIGQRLTRALEAVLAGRSISDGA